MDQQIVLALVAWFDQNARNLPWRKNYLPYPVLISEIMLQQTQVDTMLPYFERWLKKFPNFTTLAQADWQEVIHYWQGLGYYARARNLHKLAKIITEDYANQLPTDYQELIKLPGLGPYSAGAIASIAFDKKVPAIDGNVRRVFARIFYTKNSENYQNQDQFFAQKAKQLLHFTSARKLNQALMEFGALICQKNPKCALCPLRNYCLAFKHGMHNQVPKAQKTKTHHSTVIFCFYQQKKQILLQLQSKAGWWQDLYSLPYYKFDNHLKVDQIVSKLKDKWQIQSINSEKIIKSKFGISNHQVVAYCLNLKKVLGKNEQQKILQQYFSTSQYFALQTIDKIAISAQSRKIINSMLN